MSELGVTSGKPFKKSARIVGEVLGKYHPHGDSSVYMAMVRMAQSWSLRYPLVDGQGNFGSVDGDSPAAMRYTEARLMKVTEDTLVDLDKDTVDMIPNFDESLKEPSVLPTKIPLLLVNGASGIAVGMATNMPPHNLRDTIDAICAYIDDRDIEIDDLDPDHKSSGFPHGRNNLRVCRGERGISHGKRSRGCAFENIRGDNSSWPGKTDRSRNSLYGQQGRIDFSHC